MTLFQRCDMLRHICYQGSSLVQLFSCDG
uniref:Uncharacterized protein n=1 Tax=Anguilla anguilla TaxID=7936 RepID=A0A0E9QI53_ANGAN